MRIVLFARLPCAYEALALYISEIGAMIAVLGGLELLVFTVGVGENSAVIRARVCEHLRFLGLELDGRVNERQTAGLISSEHSHIAAAVEPTNEEWVAARQALAQVMSQHPLNTPRLST